MVNKFTCKNLQVAGERKKSPKLNLKGGTGKEPSKFSNFFWKCPLEKFLDPRLFSIIFVSRKEWKINRKKAPVLLSFQALSEITTVASLGGSFPVPPLWFSILKSLFNVVIMQWNLAWWTNRQFWTDLFFIL